METKRHKDPSSGPAGLLAPAWLVLLLAGGIHARDAGSAASPGPSASQRLEEAFYQEVALADPAGAVLGYRALADDPTASREVRARAHMRLGICYRLLGDAQRSREELECVIESYPLELNAVTLARRYLGEKISEDPASFMPRDLLVYVELVRPREHVRALATLVRGTPFENPVDYYVSYLESRESDGSRATRGPPGDGPTNPALRPRAATQAAAFLNEGFLRELQKIEGLAIGVPGGEQAARHFVAVFLPGTSDILRGIVQMLLTLSGAEGVGAVRDLPILRAPPQQADVAPRDPDEWLHVALGQSAVVLGRPRSLVEEAVKRWADGEAALADDPDFRRAQAARAGSLVFSYLSSSRVAESLRETLPPGSLPLFDSTQELVGWDQVHSLSFTVSHAPSDDSLRLTFRARFEGKRLEAWSSFRTPVLDPVLLEAVPADSPGFLALGLDDEPPPHRVIRRLLDMLEVPEDDASRFRLQALKDLARGDAFRDLAGQVRGLAIGMGPAGGGYPAPLRGFLVLRFDDLRRGQGALETFLIALLERLGFPPEGRQPASEELELAGRHHAVRVLEPYPGIRLRCLPLEKNVVLAFSERVLSLAAAGATVSPEAVPHRASKIVMLKTGPLLEALPDDLPPQAAALLAEVELGLLSTIEAENSLSITLTLPAITPAVRVLLEKVARRQGDMAPDSGSLERPDPQAGEE